MRWRKRAVHEIPHDQCQIVGCNRGGRVHVLRPGKGNGGLITCNACAEELLAVNGWRLA